jgi:AraC family transcriptional activator of pyochelin receptor
MASPAEMGAVEVSPEMLTLSGVGDVGRHRWPSRAVAFELDEQLTATFHERPTAGTLNQHVNSNRLILLVDRNACERLLEGQLEFVDGGSYLLPGELRTIALAIRDCRMPAPVALPYQLAKSIELLCEILRADREGELVAATAGSLSFADCRRVAAARQLIDDQWQERMSLAQIARRSGLNRSKLSRGFRELYGCSVMEALAERRLAEARRQLIATDLPVGLIGYRSGYQNNASFSRAFGRRFGVSPSDFRTQAAA